MPRFAYSAYDPAGKLVRGELDCTSDIEALDHLAVLGLTPVEVQQGGVSGPWWSREISLSGQAGALKPAALEQFFTTLSALLAASFPLPRALQYAAQQSRDQATRRVIERLHGAVENGATLASAMADAGPAFPDRLVTLVGVGEGSNTLPEVTKRIAQLLAEQARLKRELKGALVYPMILLGMSVLVMALIVFYLVPTLEPVFRSAQAALPLPLQIMSSLRSVLLSTWPVLLVGAGMLLVAALLARRSLGQHLNALAMRLPIVGRFLRQRATLEICQTMSLMLGSGATLSQALTTARKATPNPAYAAVLAGAEDTITSGGRLSDTLVGHPLIDQMSAMLLQAGEEADRLPDVLDTVTRDLTDRTRRTLTQLIQLLTPVMTLLIGFSVGAVILSTISAIMDLNDIAL